MRKLPMCEGCPKARAFHGESIPVSLEVREPSFARMYLTKFGHNTTAVDIIDQFNEAQTSLEVPNNALEHQSSIRNAMQDCAGKVGRHCGAVALLHQRYPTPPK